MANEKRLIDANKLTAVFRNIAEELTATHTTIAATLYAAIDTVTAQKTVDAVDVVRCKDCKHYKPQNQGAHRNCTTPYCMRIVSVKVNPDDFCSYGERRT